MNSLAFSKCARRVSMALAAITGIVFAVACGSSNNNITPPNKQGFNTGSFSGTYVISISGTDLNSSDDIEPFSIVGTLQPNGTGGFTTGTLDIIDPGNTGINLGATVGSTSSYSVSTDGRGTASLVTSVSAVGTLDVDFVLSSTSGGLISLFNTSTGDATGSGTIDLQTATTQSALTTLAFSLSGADSTGKALATVGGFTLNSSSGAIQAGTQDINDGNSSSPSNGTTGVSITGGSVVLSSSGTTGTGTLTNASGDSNFNSLAFNVWVVDSTHLKFDETDGVNVLSGDAFTQASFPTGQVVFTLAGQDAGGNPFTAGGYATAASNGGLSSGLEDYNDTATANTIPTFSAAASSNGAGRYQLATTGFTNVTDSDLQFAAYPSSGGVLMLENDSAGLAVGAAMTQSATALNTSGGYALNLTGVNINVGALNPGEVDDIGQFEPGAPDTTGSTTVNMTGNLDENELGVTPPSTGSLKGVYVPDTTNDGRGSITSTNSGTGLGGFTLQYYVVDGSTVLFIDVDAESVLGTDAAQIALGVFQTQTTPSSSAAARRAVFLVHPAVHSRGSAVKNSGPRTVTKYR